MLETLCIVLLKSYVEDTFVVKVASGMESKMKLLHLSNGLVQPSVAK